jgi:hypothetical protein
MKQSHDGKAAADGQAHLRGLSTRELVNELATKASLLARREVALAKSEAREDLRSEIRMASGMGVAGICALMVLQLSLLAVVLAIAEAGMVRGWLAALLVAAGVLAIGTVAGIVGWSKRVRTPMDATRRSLLESVRWVKERTA